MVGWTRAVRPSLSETVGAEGVPPPRPNGKPPAIDRGTRRAFGENVFPGCPDVLLGQEAGSGNVESATGSVFNRVGNGGNPGAGPKAAETIRES